MLQGMVGHYQVLERLGQGGMGDVFKAFDTRLQRPVAIKALHPDTVANERATARLRREALAAAAIDHPYLCHVHELIDYQGTLLIVMEYVDGETLAARLARGPLTLLETLRFMRELAEGLGAAHAQGLVHRDVKPSNIMITRHHHVKLMDFGLAKPSVPGDAETRPVSEVTATGEIIGTPFYMAPEQAAGDAADMRSDVFSVGVVLYQCLSGRLPFEGVTRTTYLTHLLVGEPQPLRTALPGVPLIVDFIAMRCLARDPAMRYGTASELAADLARAHDRIATGVLRRVPSFGRPRVTRKAVLLAGAVGVAVLIAVKVAIAPTPPASPTDRQPEHLEPLVTWPTEERDSRISPDGEWISHLSNRDNQSRIWLRRGAGADPQPIAFSAGTVVSHAWAEAGNELACVLRRDDRAWLQIVPAFFGGTPRVTVALPRSTDNMRIAGWVGNAVFVEIPGPSSLWKVTLDDQKAAVLPAFQGTPTEFARDFTIAPDGQRVAFAWNRHGREDIWTAALDGDRRTRLTDDAVADRHPLWMGPSRLVFQSNRGGQIDLWLADVAGGGARQITFSGAAETPEGVSADGSLLTLQQRDEHMNLWRLDTRTGAEQQLTADALSDAWPSIAADSRLIAFQRAKPSIESIYGVHNTVLQVGTLGAQGIGQLRQFRAGYSPALSPDGRWLAHLRPIPGDDTTAELWVADIETQQSRRLTDRSPMPGYYPYPFDRAITHVLWRTAPTELLFVTADPGGRYEVMRWRPSAWTAEPTRLLAPANPRARIQGLSLDSASTRLAAYLVAPDGRRVIVSRLDGEEATQTLALPAGVEGPVALLGFRRGTGGPLVVHRLTREDDAATVEVIELAERGVRRFGPIAHALPGSIRVAPGGDGLYLTRADGLTHNLHAFDLQRGTLRPLTTNQSPSVTFAGLTIDGPHALIYSRQDVKLDIWLIRFPR